MTTTHWSSNYYLLQDLFKKKKKSHLQSLWSSHDWGRGRWGCAASRLLMPGVTQCNRSPPGRWKLSLRSTQSVSEAQLEHVVIFWGGDCFTTLAGLPDKCVLFIFFHVVVRTWRDWSASRCVLILSSPHHDVWYVRFAPLRKHSKTKFSVCVCVCTFKCLKPNPVSYPIIINLKLLGHKWGDRDHFLDYQ